MVLFSELMNKDVINVRDGSRLGHIQDHQRCWIFLEGLMVNTGSNGIKSVKSGRTLFW